MFTQSLRFGFVGLLVFAVSTWASSTPVGPSTVQGDVKDSKGQPVAGAEMHIRAKDGSGFYRIAHTDANGHYAVSKLPNTDYEVVLFFNGAVKATINNTKTFANKPTQLDFKLTGQYAANKVKKHTHMVYVPAETGSNLSGRWVEVDDNTDTSAALAGANDVKKAGNATIRAVQSNSGAILHPNGGGN
jgi:Carboxypeptidase regulatory-like domain